MSILNQVQVSRSDAVSYLTGTLSDISAADAERVAAALFDPNPSRRQSRDAYSRYCTTMIGASNTALYFGYLGLTRTAP
jgi:hypothetical protein